VRERARAQFGDLVHVRFVPYDLPGSVRRFFDRVQPRLAIILETELWPNLYNECGRRGVPLVLASARISPRSVDRYRRLASLFRETLSHGIVIAAQSEGDAERFRSIGANPTRTHVTGNIKFDFVSLPPDIAAVGAGCERTRRGGPCGSRAARTRARRTPCSTRSARCAPPVADALLVLVPRHRFAEAQIFADRVRRSCCRAGRGVRRSCAAHPAAHCTRARRGAAGRYAGRAAGNFYAAADVAFVGGSLVPIGGHNLLEPQCSACRS
jgi:3-deoxy-D-manno-octulosonic-acid transferase